MKTYFRSVFLPFVGLQILFKLLDTFLVVIYSHFLYSNPFLLQGAGAKAMGGGQLLLSISPFILFLGYKYFYKHMIPIMILLMCGLISAVGLQWGAPVLLNSLRGTIKVLIEGVLFWQLILLTTSEDKARWFFPFYILLASAFVLLMHRHWAWTDKINMQSLTQLYGILAVLAIAMVAIVYRFQSLNNVKLQVHGTFMQSLGAVFTNPLFIGVLFILIGSNVVNQVLRMPVMTDTLWHVNAVGISFTALAFLILPKDFLSKNMIIAGFALWIVGINVMGVQALFDGVMQVSKKEMFVLMWPMVILYPLLYRGFLAEDPESRILGFTYVIIFSFLLSRMLDTVLRLI
jgi:hypothetical protein